MVIEIDFKSQKCKFISRNNGGDFGKRFGLSQNSIGAVDIVTYQGKVSIEYSHYSEQDKRKIEWQVKIACDDAVQHSFDVDMFKENVIKNLAKQGIIVTQVNIENAVQEMFEVSNRRFSPNVLHGDKESLVLEDEQPQPGSGQN